MLDLVRHAKAWRTFSEITKCQYLWEVLSYFIYLLHVLTHLWKLQCYRVILVGYGLYAQSSEINRWCLWKGLSDFVGFSHAVICILLDIHCSYKSMLFWVGIVRHRLSANQIVRCFKPKKLEKYMRYQVEFLLPLKQQKISCYFGLWPPKNPG